MATAVSSGMARSPSAVPEARQMERRTRTTGRSKGLLRRVGLGLETSPLAQGFQAIVPCCAALPRAFDALLVYSSRMAKGAFSAMSLSRSPAVAVFALAALLAGYATPGVAEDKERGPCIEDAMLVFDASGSMAGNLNQGIATTIPRIDEVRSALAKVLPSVTRFRRIGLITYGPGPYQQCNVQLALKPTPDAASRIMQEVNALTPAGKTPLTVAVEQAAQVLDYEKKPGLIVVLTDGEETCGGAPCDLGKML